MRKLALAAAAAALVGLFAGSAMAQSAKFAATWDNDVIMAEAHASCDGDCPDSDGPNLVAEVEMATIHISTHKSVLVGVSAQIGIMLFTEAKGKGGTGSVDISSTAKAEGGVDVTLTLVDPGGAECMTIAPTDTITLKSEMRELTVGATTSAEDVEVVVGILTDSVGAHHFNFLGVECEQGWYTLTATFDLSALAEVTGLKADADVVVSLGSRIITLQEVRAVKGSLVED